MPVSIAMPLETPPDSAPGGVITSFHLGEGCRHGAHAAGPLLPGCAVAICTYKRSLSLKRFLASLAKQERRPDQLIIVDASPDAETEGMVASEAWVGSLAPCFQYFRVGEPLRGLTRQRNFALRQVSTDLLAFFDDDVVLEPRCLQELEGAHRTSAEPVAGVGALADVDRVTQAPLWRLRRLLRIVPALEPGRYYPSGMSTPWAFLRARQGLFEGDWLPGAAMVWRTAVARELKFNEAFHGYAQGEDLEFSLRAAAFGKLLVAAGARYRDDHAPEGRPDPYHLGYMAIRNRYLIHLAAFPHRGFRVVAWFAYAWTLDTLLFARHLLFPGRWGSTLLQVAGRARAAIDLLRGLRERGKAAAPAEGTSPWNTREEEREGVSLMSDRGVEEAASQVSTRRRPNEKSPARLLFFWDYDTQWGGDRSRSGGGPKQWGRLEFENTERLLDLHAEYDIPSCFAVVGSAALEGSRPYHDPAQIRRIHAMGHEIGSHSLRHDWLPGLARKELLETLRGSKDALEQCIGAPVATFVPPWNQPFDYPPGLSFSLSERREAVGERTDLAVLCEALQETGYGFCRVAYRPLPQRFLERLLRRRLDRPSRVKTIRGIACVRLNTPAGFDGPAGAMLERCVTSGGLAIIWGHPHSLSLGNSQDERFLVPLLQRIRDLKGEGRLKVCLPRELLAESPETV